MGKITYVTCYYCGRKVPRDKAVVMYKRPRFLPPNVEVDFVGFDVEKVYVCISCAKHRGISFADWRRKLVAEERKRLQKARKQALGKKKRAPAAGTRNQRKQS